MSYDLDLFDKMDELYDPVHITLPDGSVKHVTLGGSLRLDDHILLKRVLYVHEFKFNLLSVYKLLATQRLCIHIYPTECIFQDLTTRQVVAKAHEHSGMYFLESSNRCSFKKDSTLGKIVQNNGVAEKVTTQGCFTIVNKACSQVPLEVLHARLGHTSLSEMKYISDCKDVISDTFFCEVCILAKDSQIAFCKEYNFYKESF